MPRLQTLHFGDIEYEPEALIEFPAGLPAFEEERSFVLIRQPEPGLVIFLQSLRDPGLVFVTLPAQAIDPAYRLELSEEEWIAAGFNAGRARDEAECLILAVVTIPDGGAMTANLMAPIVIDRAGQRGAQVIQAESEYSHQFPLESPQGEAQC
jgi:flagellar assembly factor FliW